MRPIPSLRLLLPVVALLLLLFAAAPPAAAAEKPTLGLRYATLTPDNQHVVFAYRGDIWIAPVDGKSNARRLTIHEAQDTIPRVSPDGKTIAFISRRGGGYDVYTVGIDGGMPKQITFHSAGEVLCDWSPDGKRLLVLTARHPSFAGLDLYEVDLTGGTPRRITRDGGREGTYAADGKKIVYVRGFNTIYQDNYTGSANYDIYTVDGPGALPKQLTQTDGNERWPCFSKDGKTIWFVAEEKGVANFYALPAEGGKRTQVTKFKQDVWRPDLGWDGKTVVFEQSGLLYTADLTAKAPKATPIPVVVKSDVRHSGIEIRQITKGPEQVHVSPGGDTLAFSVHGDIWTLPASGGEGRRRTEGKDKDEWPRFSPDGRSIAYQSDKGGDSNIWLLDLKTGQKRQLTKHRADDYFHAWSPDGEKLVFSSERSGNRDIWTLEIDSGRLEQITRDKAPDDDPAFSPDGQWIAFDSGREGSQAIYVVPAEGGDPRRVTTDSGFLQVPSWSPDGSMLVYESFNAANGGSLGLYVISSRGGPSVQLTRNGSGAIWSPKGDYIFHTIRRNGSTEIYRTPAPTSIDLSERVPFAGRIEVDRRTEFGDLFDEVWTHLKEGFYDPKMHGVKWDDMKEKYRPIAVEAEIKGEFHNVINQLLAELGASHLGIRGGQEPTHTVRPKRSRSGHLGLEFASEPVKGGGLRVEHVLPGGPADELGLRVGDVVTRLGRKRLRASTNLDSILTDAEGKELSITFRPFTPDGLGTERRRTIEAASWRTVAMRNFANWVKKNAKFVKDETKGKAGYVHLDMMNPANLNKFRQAVAGWNRSKKIKGMVLDVRFNGGGNIHIPLMQILTAKPLMQFQPRGLPKVKQPSLYWDKPVVVLINERSFSDAEVFPDAFRAAKIGKIVGAPTAGGVIGTTDVQLSDGSTLRIPRVGYYSMDGTKLEGQGVRPDILVIETPEDRRTGTDRQLAKAVEVILAEIAALKKTEKPTKPEKTKPEKTPKTPKTPETPAKPPKTPVAKAGPKTPLADVRVGEWVRYRVTFGGAVTVLKHQVVSVSDGMVRFETTVEQGGEFLPPLPDEIEIQPILESLPALGRVVSSKVGREKVLEVLADVLSVSVEWGDIPVEVVFTNAVPALGLFVARAGGETVLEAVAWGGPEAPAATPVAEAKPEPKPEPKPDPKPEPKPEPESEPEPEPEPEAEASTAPQIPNPLYDAQPGEWIKLKQSAGGLEAYMILEVVDADEESVTIHMSIEQGDRHMDGPEREAERERYIELTDPDEVQVRHEKATVGDTEFDCTVLTRTNPRGVEVEQWISNDVPVTGLVKIVRGGEVIRELVEWGTDGAP